MLDKLREENDTIYNDVTSKIASIKASYEKKMTSLKAKYEERLRDLKEELSDFKELHQEFNSVGEILKMKDLQIKNLKVENSKLEGELEAKEDLIERQRDELEHNKSIMESRISELENVVNSERFRECNLPYRFSFSINCQIV